VAEAQALSRIEDASRRAARDLDALERRWALVGGLAVSARTEPRFTRDADLVVFVTDDRDAEVLVLALQVAGYRVLAAVEEEATGRLEVLPGFRIPAAERAYLIALKVLSRDDRTRPQDLGDLRALLSGASPSDVESVRRALGLVVSRGFHRGRDLVADLDAVAHSIA
jgi:hypothetical protein